MNQEECAERIRLVEEYSRCVTEYGRQREALKRQPGAPNDVALETAFAESQRAWEAFSRHMAEHQCMQLQWTAPEAGGQGASSEILANAAEAALDMILVADDDRRFVGLNQAAADRMGLPRSEILGRRIDEFFSEAGGRSIPEAWNSFISDGIQCGICELRRAGRSQRFEYRAKANFASGLHLSVLREQPFD